MIRNRIYEKLFMNRDGDTVRCRSQWTTKQLLQSHTHCFIAVLSKRKEVTCIQFEEDLRVQMFDGLKSWNYETITYFLSNCINFMFRTRKYTLLYIYLINRPWTIFVLPGFFFLLLIQIRSTVLLTIKSKDQI